MREPTVAKHAHCWKNYFKKKIISLLSAVRVYTLRLSRKALTKWLKDRKPCEANCDRTTKNAELFGSKNAYARKTPTIFHRLIFPILIGCCAPWKSFAPEGSPWAIGEKERKRKVLTTSFFSA